MGLGAPLTRSWSSLSLNVFESNSLNLKNHHRTQTTIIVIITIIVITTIIVSTIIIILTREKKRENPRTNKFLVEFKSTNCRLERPTLLLGWKLWFSFDNGDRKLLTAMIIPNMTQKIPPTIGLGMVRKRDPGNIFRVIFQSGLRNSSLSVQ